MPERTSPRPQDFTLASLTSLISLGFLISLFFFAFAVSVPSLSVLIARLTP